MVRLLQLESSDPKTLELAGHAAPHGRPRKGAVATVEKRVREAEVYYAGDSPPTRHIFGSKSEPIEMKGRFSDSKGGLGFAKAKHREVDAFFNDKRQIEVIWDDIIDVVGLMTKYTAKPEGPGDFEYEIEIKIDRDLLAGVAFAFPPVVSPKSITSQIMRALLLKDQLPKVPPTMKGSVVDLLDGLVGTLNSASAGLVHLAEDLDSFATGTFTAIERFRAGLGQTRVAVQSLRNTYDSLLTEVALESEIANHTQPFWDLQAGWSASSLEALRLLAEAERQAAVAQQGNVLALHDASLGDTWESISTRYYGSAHRGEDIRVANGVLAGTGPVPGTVYVVPR